jgi:hypothetical protein
MTAPAIPQASKEFEEGSGFGLVKSGRFVGSMGCELMRLILPCV